MLSECTANITDLSLLHDLPVLCRIAAHQQKHSTTQAAVQMRTSGEVAPLYPSVVNTVESLPPVHELPPVTPPILSGSSEEVRQQRQCPAWSLGPEGAGSIRQQAFPSASDTSGAAPASPSRVRISIIRRCCQCRPGCRCSSLEAAAWRRVSVRQLLHKFDAECEGQATHGAVHRLRRGPCRRGQDQGRHQDQNETLLHQAEGDRRVATQLACGTHIKLGITLGPTQVSLNAKYVVCMLCDQVLPPEVDLFAY